MPLFESNNHPNANGSKILALVNILTFVIGIFLPVIFPGDHIHVVSTLILGAITAVSATIGFKNTFETNDAWKTYFQAASTFANIVIPAIFISLQYNV